MTKSIFRNLQALLCIVCLNNIVVLVAVYGSNTGDVSRCSSKLFTPDFGCNDLTLEIVYASFGVMDCNGSYTLSQTQDVPGIKLSSVEESSFYTVLMVDTSDSDIHPIMHYGAVNVPGSQLVNGVNLDDVSADNTFFSYNGPSPPNFLRLSRSQRKQRFLYEWIFSKQTNGSVRKPKLSSSVQVKYREFLKDTEVVSTSLFTSGFCVRPSKK